MPARDLISGREGMSMRIVMWVVIATLLTAGGCATRVPRSLPGTNPEARMPRETDTSCPAGQVRVYRPSSKSKSPADAAIPPTYDTPSRADSHCARPY